MACMKDTRLRHCTVCHFLVEMTKSSILKYIPAQLGTREGQALEKQAVEKKSELMLQ